MSSERYVIYEEISNLRMFSRIPGWSLVWKLHSAAVAKYLMHVHKTFLSLLHPTIWDSTKNGWNTGISVPGALKLDHLQPVKLFLSKNISYFLIFKLGLLFLITPERGKWEKGIQPKIAETQGFECLGQSNWTICSLLSWICSEIFPTFSLSYWGAHSNYPRGLIMGKENSPNYQYGWDWGVSVPGAF